MPKIAKIFTAALLVLTALGVVGPTGAQAVLFHKTNMGNTVIAGGQLTPIVLTIPEGATACEIAGFKGETEETTPAALTLTVVTDKCEFAKLGKGNATENMNGCDFNLFAAGTVSIICPSGKAITIVASPAGVKKCTITIPGSATTGTPKNQNLSTVTYKNETDGSVTVTLNLGSITYSTKTGTGAGACTETAETTGGTLTGSFNLTGTTGGVRERIWVE